MRISSKRAAPRGPQRIRTRLGAIEAIDSGTGEAVVALHGAMGGCDQSLLLARTALGDAPYRVLALSRPGYLATPLRNGKTPEAQADLIAALLDERDIDRAIVIAVSGGGPAAVQFALRHGGRCRALILVSAPVIRMATAEQNVRRLKAMRLMTALPCVETLMRHALLRHPDKAIARTLPDAEARAQLAAHGEAHGLMMQLMVSTMTCMSARMDGTMNDIAQCATFDPPLERLTAPVLGIYGMADDIVPFAHAEALASRAPMATILSCETGRHVSLFTHLDAVRVELHAFLARV